MKNKLQSDMKQIVASYQTILSNWSDFGAFQSDLVKCQNDINLLEFSQEDYLNEEVHGLLLELKKMHHMIYEKSLTFLAEAKKKHETVASSKNKLLKYTPGE